MNNDRYYKSGPASKAFDVFNTVILTMFMICVIYPLWNQLAISLNNNNIVPSTDIFLFPKIFSVTAYEYIFTNSNILRGAGVSLLRAVVGTTLTLLCTGLLAYITTIRNFSGRTFMRRIFVVTMYFSGGLIPTYILMVKLKLLNTFAVYILPSMLNAYYMLLIASFIQNIPESLFEAARIDGATELKIYLKVVLPTCVPVFAAVAIFSAVGQWNAWFDCMIYNPNGNWDTLQIILRRLLLQQEAFEKIHNEQMALSRFRSLTSDGLRAATIMIVTVPILIVYPFFQKYFVSGITIGSVKG
jgi:putative aldouronate transport system permease protein